MVEKKQKFILQWHITHKCNLRCSHCYQEEYCSDLQEEEYKKIFQQMIGFLKNRDQKGHVNLTGGEPLVSPFFTEICGWLEQETMIKSFGILTNGTLLDEEMVVVLKSYQKLSFVQISLDGNEKTHEEIRGAGTFQKALQAVKLLRKYHIQTMISFTVSKKNHTQLEEVVEICRKNKVDRFWTDRVVPMGNAITSEKEESIRINNQEAGEDLLLSKEEFVSFVKRLYELSAKEKKNPFSKLTVHTNRAMQFFGNCNELGGYHCGAGKNLAVIVANGDVLPCRRLPIVLGNLLEKDMITIWEENQEKVKEIHKLPEHCRSCIYVGKCRGGAKCLTYALYGNFKEKDYHCPV